LISATNGHVEAYHCETVPTVRIPLPPPRSLECREIRPDCSGNYTKWAQFRNFSYQRGPEKMAWSTPRARFAAFFSEGHPASAVSKISSGECNAITNR
jgi:hypothetical protein